MTTSHLRSPAFSPLEPRLHFAAGNLVAQDKTPIIFTSANGVAVTVTLKGPGTATLGFADTSAPKANPTSFTLDGTTAKTQVSLTSASPILLSTLTGNSPVGKFLAPTTNFTGTLSLAGVGTLTMATLTSTTLTVGAALPTTSVSLGDCFDSKVTLAGNVKALSVLSFTTTDTTADPLNVAAVSTLKLGAFSGNLTATGDLGKATLTTVSNAKLTLAGKAALTAASLANTTVSAPNPSLAAKLLTNSTLTGSASIGTVKIAGAMSGTTITSPGSIGAVSAATITTSTIAAGVTTLPTTFPTASPFTNDAASIKSVRVAAVGGSFSNSLVVAPTIGKSAVGAVTLANGSKTYGFFANAISTITLSVNSTPVIAKASKTPTAYLQGDFHIQVI